MKNTRSALTSAMTTAWNSVIHEHYNAVDHASPDINSEAALQAYFFHELRKNIAEAESVGSMPKNTRVFMEAVIRHQKGTTRPDLIVCRNSMVIAFVELKYLPRMTYEGDEHGGFAKDGNSLRDLYQSGGEYIHERYQGAFKATHGEKFKFSTNTLLVWGGVYKADEQFRVNEIISLAKDYPVLELLAITNQNAEAKVLAYFAGSAIELRGPLDVKHVDASGCAAE